MYFFFGKFVRTHDTIYRYIEFNENELRTIFGKKKIVYHCKTKKMALNLLDLLTETQKGCFTTIYVPNEVK
jgi:hypothetical protein